MEVRIQDQIVLDLVRGMGNKVARHMDLPLEVVGLSSQPQGVRAEWRLLDPRLHRIE